MAYDRKGIWARKIISTVGLDIHRFKGYKKMTARLAFV
jgi:hypothetical protein